MQTGRKFDAASKRRSRAGEDDKQTLSRRETDAANHRRTRSLETPDERLVINTIKLNGVQLLLRACPSCLNTTVTIQIIQ